MLKPLLVVTLLLSHHAFSFACEQFDASESDFPESLTQNTEPNQGVVAAWYDGATDRYGHGVLGDAIEPSILSVKNEAGCSFSVVLDDTHVFEDIQTRLADIDNSPGLEVITIRSHQNKGAQIAIFKLSADKGLHLLTTTPYIGTSNRWLAPVGIADFNSDGDIDIAFVDRPHLAKVLRVWSYRDGELQQIASKAGYSNHKIGEDFISGGLKICDGKTTMITADAIWTRILETSLQDGKLVSNDIGAFDGTRSLTDALLCK